MLKSSFPLEGVRRGNGPAGARSGNTLRHLCQLSLNTARLDSPRMQPGQKCAPAQRRSQKYRLWLSDIETDNKPVQAVSSLIFKTKKLFFLFLPNKDRDKESKVKYQMQQAF